MGKLRYYDGSIAVCDFEIGENDDAKAVELLLGIDADSPKMEKDIKPLLECWGIPQQFSSKLLSQAEKGLIMTRADSAKLKELGISLEDNEINPVMRFSSSTCLRLVASIPRTVSRIRDVSLFLQYLAKLHLLASGDLKQESLLPDARLEATTIAFDANLPDLFFFALAGCTLPVPAYFDIDAASPSDQEGYTAMPVRIGYNEMLRFPGEEDGLFVLPSDDFQLKRLVAAYLLSSLVNYCSTMPFGVNPSTLELMRNESSTFASALADFAIERKIGSCPLCGRPVFMPRKTSKPFCRQSHQTRYNEKARKMLGKGASVDEVSDAFPYIRYGTISGWLPIGGRSD